VKSFRYSLFGSSLSCNLPIPDLPISNSTSAPPDIQLHLGISPEVEFLSTPDSKSEKLTYVSSYTDASGEPALRVWEPPRRDYLHFVYTDGTEFWLDREGSSIRGTWPGQSSLENATSYLLGPILGFALRLRGVVCLHASAVAFADRCVAFVGPAGAGKSTTAAAFARSGRSVISDDIVGLVEREGQFYVLPAYPHLCLWPESVQVLYGSHDALPRFIQDWEKRRLPLGEDGARFEDRTLLLDAVYLLGTRRAQAAPLIDAIPSAEALLALVANTYATNLIDRDMRAEEFALLGRLVSRARIRRVQASDDPRRLDELCCAIRDDLEAQAPVVPIGGTNPPTVI
jgi:hypothetical protein